MRGLQSNHEAEKQRQELIRNTKKHKTLNTKYLELRKLLREYSKEREYEFPEHIQKAIGIKQK